MDAALGRKEEAVEEAKHAVEMLPVSQDGWDGPLPVLYQTRAYALTGETDLALQNLEISIKTPGATQAQRFLCGALQNMSPVC